MLITTILATFLSNKAAVPNSNVMPRTKFHCNRQNLISCKASPNNDKHLESYKEVQPSSSKVFNFNKASSLANYVRGLETLNKKAKLLSCLDSEDIRNKANALRPLLVEVSQLSKQANIDPPYKILKMSELDIQSMDSESLYFMLKWQISNNSNNCKSQLNQDELEWSLNDLNKSIRDLVTLIESKKLQKISYSDNLNSLKELVLKRERLKKSENMNNLIELSPRKIEGLELANVQRIRKKIFDKSQEIYSILRENDKNLPLLYEKLFQYALLKDPNKLLIELSCTTDKDLGVLAERWLNEY